MMSIDYIFAKENKFKGIRGPLYNAYINPKPTKKSKGKIDPHKYVYQGSPHLIMPIKPQKHRTNSVFMGENENEQNKG